MMPNFFDPKDPGTTYSITFRCEKCNAEVEVKRPAVHLNEAILGDFKNVPFPKREELKKAGIPSCSKWKAIHAVMES